MSVNVSRNQWLDLCRAIAVTLVVLSHGFELFHKESLVPFQTLFGVMGVEIFFCLSGFLIGSIFIGVIRDFDGSPRTLLNFMGRRWMRTLPNYYFYLAINLWMLWGGWLAVKQVDVAQYFVFAQNLLSPHPTFFPEAWSLAVEEVFYLLLPTTFLVAWALMRRPMAALVAALLALFCMSMALRYNVAVTDLPWDGNIRKIALLRLDSLMWGVMLAVVHWHLAAHQPRRLRAMGWIMLCFLPLPLFGFTTGIPGMSEFVFRFLMLTFASIGICGALSLGMGMRLPRPVAAVTSRLSKWSYSMYLANMPLYYFALHYLEFGQSFAYRFAEFFSYVALVVVASIVTYTLIEKPFLALRDRLIPDTRGKPHAATGDAAARAR